MFSIRHVIFARVTDKKNANNGIQFEIGYHYKTSYKMYQNFHQELAIECFDFVSYLLGNSCLIDRK